MEDFVNIDEFCISSRGALWEFTVNIDVILYEVMESNGSLLGISMYFVYEVVEPYGSLLRRLMYFGQDFV
jgi:hypothetical protein